MFYLYLFLHTFIIVLLSPIRWSLNTIVRFTWKPAFQFKPELFKNTDVSLDDLEKKADEIHNNLKKNINKIKNAGDSVKFISIWYVATGDKDVLDLIKKYIKDGKLNRKADTTTNKNFSGDMWAGLSYMLTEMYFSREIDIEKDFKEEIIKALDNALFEKPYLIFKSNSRKQDRGYLLRWFFANSGHFLPILILLQLMYKLTRKRKYLYLYHAIFPVAAIDILINPTFAVALGRNQYLQWYYIHSNFLFYYSLYRLTGSRIYKYALNFLYKRFWFNPDFAGLLGKKNIVLLWAKDYIKKPDRCEKIWRENVAEFKNLKDLLRLRKATEYYSKVIIPPRCRRNDYQWEKALNGNEYKYNSHLAGIDFLHLIYLLRGRNGLFNNI